MTSHPVLTFSGDHPFDGQHAGGRGPAAERLVADGWCPRCEGALYPEDAELRAILRRPGDDVPTWRPGGSRETACRCIPLCETCQTAVGLGTLAPIVLGSIESVPDKADALTYLVETQSSAPDRWPLDRDRMTLGLAVVLAWIEQTSGIEVRIDGGGFAVRINGEDATEPDQE